MVPRPGPANQALENAKMAFQMQRLDEAERLAAGVLKSDRGNVVAAQVFGRALMMQGRLIEAIEPLQRVARRSQDPTVETLLAAAYAAAGRRDDAFAQLRATTARRPPFAPAFLEFAGQLGKAARFAEAIALLEQALALMPGAVELQTGLGHLYLETNARTRARALLAQARAAVPDRLDTLVSLAKVLALDGDYAAAADLYRRILTLQPDDALNRINLAKCLLELGDRDAAEAQLRAAARGGGELPGRAATALTAAPRGRFFLRPSAMSRFLRAEKN